MALDLTERARRYVALMDGAVSGSDGHGATFKVACVLVKGFGLPLGVARGLLDEYNARCVPPWSPRELEHKIAEADRTPDDRERGWLAKGGVASGGDGVAPEPRAERERKPWDQSYDPILLAKMAEPCRWVIDRAWLGARSPVAVEWSHRPGLGADFLSMLYGAEERVIVFTVFDSQGQFIWAGGKTYRLGARGVKAVPSAFPTSGPKGVWFLTNPVVGTWQMIPGWGDRPAKWTRRSGCNVTAWRYLLLESDKAPADLWLRMLVQLDLRIAAIYTSGSRSVHALIRVDAANKEDFDGVRTFVRDVLARMGVDIGAMKGVQLSRLPGCWREEKRARQELWYLDPAPRGGGLLHRPALRVIGKESEREGQR